MVVGRRELLVCINATGTVDSMLIQHSYVDHGMRVQVVRTDFSPQDWSKRKAHYTVAIEAAIDNDSHDDDLPLAPWS